MNERLIALYCASPELVSAGDVVCAILGPTDTADTPLPDSIVWMPAGDHEISASTPGGGVWRGLVRCDESGARAVQMSYEREIAAGRKPWLDRLHDNGEATAWIKGFSWDARGIIASVEWTALGAQMLREKRLRSFSPTFMVNRDTSRVASLVPGMAGGGLVNAPAFGAAMPALIAARLAGAETHVNPAPSGLDGNKNQDTQMKDRLIKLLAALGVNVPADATEDALNAILAEHTPKVSDVVKAAAKLEEVNAELAKAKAANKDPKEDAAIVALQAQVKSLVDLASAQKAKEVTAVVAAAVADGRITKEAAPAWEKNILANADAAVLLASLAKPQAAASGAVVINSDVAQRKQAVSVVQARAGLIDSLKAYAAVDTGNMAVTASQRGAIYADAIAPVLASTPNLDLFPILADNSLGKLVGDIVTQRSLSLLKLSFPSLFAFSTDFSGEGAAFGQVITTRTRSIPAVASFVAGTGYAVSDATTANVNVTINRHRAVPISFNTNELGGTARNLFAEQAEGAHYALGKDLVDAIYALLLKANFANETVSTLNDFARSKMTAMAKALNARGVPMAGRVALLSSDFFDKLSQDSSIVSYAAFQRPELITEYMLPRVAGFQPYEAPNMITTNYLVGFAGTPGALVVATRPPNDYTTALGGSSNGSVSLVTNPDTGITVQLVQYVDHDKAASYWRIALMSGVAVGQAAEGQRLVTQATT